MPLLYHQIMSFIAKDGINYHFYGFSVNALMSGKVILVAEDFHFAEWFREQRPIYAILAKLAAFTILFYGKFKGKDNRRKKSLPPTGEPR